MDKKLKLYKFIARLFFTCLIINVTISCTPKKMSNCNINTPNIFELANSQIYIDLEYNEIIANFDSSSSKKMYIYKKLKNRKGYINILKLITIKKHIYEIETMEWIELLNDTICEPNILGSIVRTKNILTNENQLVCKRLDEVLMASDSSFFRNFNNLEELIKVTPVMLNTTENKMCPELKSEWDVLIINKKDTSRLYRINEIEKELMELINKIN